MLDADFEIASAVSRHDEGGGVAQIFEVLYDELLAASFALHNLDFVPLRVIVLLIAVIEGHNFAFFVLATVLLVQSTHGLIVFRDISFGLLITVLRLLAQRYMTFTALAHRLHQCLVRLVFAEIVAPRAVQLRRRDHLTSIRPPQVDLRRVIIDLTKLESGLLLRRVILRPLVSLFSSWEVATDHYGRLLVDVDIDRRLPSNMAR